MRKKEKVVVVVVGGGCLHLGQLLSCWCDVDSQPECASAVVVVKAQVNSEPAARVLRGALVKLTVSAASRLAGSSLGCGTDLLRAPLRRGAGLSGLFEVS